MTDKKQYLLIKKSTDGVELERWPLSSFAEAKSVTGSPLCLRGIQRSMQGSVYKGYRWDLTSTLTDLPDEQWVQAHEGKGTINMVSNMGRLKIVTKGGFQLERLAKGDIDHDGYLKWCIDGKLQRAGRVVGRLFVDGYEEHLTIDHQDGDITNNKATNLKWMSREENSQDRHNIDRWAQYEDGLLVRTYRNAAEAIKRVDPKDAESLSNAVYNLKRGFGGYTWVSIPFVPMSNPNYISKDFDLDYGHRVWSQELDGALSCDSVCKCRRIHSHGGIVNVELQSSELNNGMVMDYTDLKFFKAWLDDCLDHRFIIDVSDPYFERITGFIPGLVEWGDYFGVLPADDEITESFVVVDFIPTSENFAKFYYDVVSDKLSGLKNVTVKSVTFKEGPKTAATYEGGRHA